MRRWLILGLLLLLPVVGWAQATPKIYWEHDGLNLTTFKCVVDDGTASEVTFDLGLLTADSGTTYSTDITNCGPGGTGIMVAGAHTLIIQACNGTTCTSATAITVVKL